MVQKIDGRRRLIRYSIGLAAIAVVCSVQLHGQSDTIQTNVPALKDVYSKDFYIGCLLSYRNIGFATDPPVPGQSAVVTPNGGYLIKFHMNSMSPGNNMKPQYTVDITTSAAAYAAATTDSARDSIDTHPVIKFNGDIIAQLNWVQRQGFTFRGHTLVWHSQTPSTFFRTGYTSTGARLTKDKMTRRLDNYIKEVIRAIHEGWPGLLSAFDVVNEAVNDTGGDRTTDSEWYLTFGDNSYIMKAFELARKYTTLYGETQIKLYYNDYNTSLPAKADGIVRVCTPIFQAGFLDGIGMQEHDANTSPTAQDWIATYNKFSPICTEMAVTELDVTTGSATPSAAVLATQANQYGQLFKCFVERSYRSGRGKIISVSKDGLNDQYTFKTNQSSSLWDALNKCKPAFFAVAHVGSYYNALDSLISYADTLHQNRYTPESFSMLGSALAIAMNAKTQNYSASFSADTALGTATSTLTAAIQGLVPISSGVAGARNVVPDAYALHQNYPNPFNPSTQIEYSVPKASYVTLKVYNLLGMRVATLFDGVRQPGNYVVTFNGAGLSSGIYFYRLQARQTDGGQAGNFSEIKRLVLLK